MKRNRRHLWPVIILLALVALSLIACGGQSPAETTRDIATGAVDVAVEYMPYVDLPRLTLIYDESGALAIFGVVRTSSIERFVPVDLGFLELRPDQVGWLVERNVQHIELDIDKAGLFIYVNGKALPYLAWDRDSLVRAGGLLDRLDVVERDTLPGRAVPLLGRIGIDVVAAFPKRAGAATIPVRDKAKQVMAEAGPIEKPTATIQAVVEYSDEGVPSVVGITSREIGRWIQADLRSVELTGDELARLEKAGVQNISAATEADGLHLVVNEHEVIHLAYNEQHLNNAIDVYAQIDGDNAGELATLLHKLVPLVCGADIDIVIELPTGKSIAR